MMRNTRRWCWRFSCLGLLCAGLRCAGLLCGRAEPLTSRGPTRRGRSAASALSPSEEVRQQLLDAGVCGDVEKRSTSSSNFMLETDRGRCFVKCGTGGQGAGKEILEYEAEALRRLAAAAGPALKVPEPWLVGELSPGRAFIVQEHLELGGSMSLDRLGAGLAALHAAAPPADWQHFGFPLEGCCGACPQKNNAGGRAMNWVDFWKEYRLGDQLRMLRRNSPADSEIQDVGADLLEKVPEFFEPLGPAENIKPSLLHGDLWSGNIASLRDGTPVIIDPASYYGHHEADHGINIMFGGGSAFNNHGYMSRFPRAPGYQQRAMLYELHHHMNHYNIFGSGYRGGCLALMRRLLR